MAIRFTGFSAENSNTGGKNYQAVDINTGRVFSVEASAQAVADYDVEAIERKASEKHDSGHIDNENKVIVDVKDFS